MGFTTCARPTLATSRSSVYARPLVSQALALALYSGRFWPVSIALVAKAIGATIASSFSRGSSFTTALTVRTAVNRHDTEALSHWQTKDDQLQDHQSDLEAARRLPPATLSESQGKLMEAVDESPPKDKHARIQARKNSMTAMDDPYEASGSKEGPGRVSRGHHISSTYSPSERRSSAGASSSSSCEIVIGSSTPSFAAQGNADQDILDA